MRIASWAIGLCVMHGREDWTRAESKGLTPFSSSCCLLLTIFLNNLLKHLLSSSRFLLQRALFTHLIWGPILYSFFRYWQ